MVPYTCTDTRLQGFMPFNRQFGLVFTNATGSNAAALARTAAHELAHGTFNLRHTFSPENEYVLSEGTTDNLMDYPSAGSGLVSVTEATQLNKYQWDAIHNPQRVWFSWLEEEKEGEISYINVIEAIRSANKTFQKSVLILDKWKKEELINISIDELMLVSTAINTKILKSNIEILTIEPRIEELENTNEVKVIFFEKHSTNQPALIFELEKEKLSKFLRYLGIIDLLISGDGILFENSQTIALISENLIIPKIKFSINVEPIENTNFEISYQLRYKLHYEDTYKYNGQDKPFTFDHPEVNKTGKLISKNTSIELALDEILGGDLLIKWEYGSYKGSKTILIRGENPNNSLIKSEAQKYIGEYWFFDKIIGHESTNRQFQTAGVYAPIDFNKKVYKLTDHYKNQKGLPLYGPPGGIGLCQLDNWDVNGQKRYCNAEQSWNWKKNMEAAAKEVLPCKIKEVYDLKHIKDIMKYINQSKRIIMDDFTIGNYTFTLINSTFFPQIDFKSSSNNPTRKSFLDAVLIKKYNGGCIISDVVEEETETYIDGKLTKIKQYRIVFNNNSFDYLKKVLE